MTFDSLMNQDEQVNVEEQLDADIQQETLEVEAAPAVTQEVAPSTQEEVIDPKQFAGAPRRIIEKQDARIRELQSQTETIHRAYTELQAKMSGYDQMAGNMGLSGEEVSYASQLLKAYKENPKTVIEHLLTDARQRGIALDDLGVGGAIDTRAIQQMLDQRLAPITNQYQQQVEQRNQQQAVEREVHQFIAAHPYADVHQDVLANMIERGTEPQTAYWQLKAAVTEHGLDFTKPLRPQYEARQQVKAVPAPTKPQGEWRPNTNQVQPQQQQLAPKFARDDHNAVIAWAMQQAGYTQ